MDKERLTSLKQTLQRNKEFTTLDVIEQLEQQIEKMKCCENCVNEDYDEDEEPCRSCLNRSKWELAE